MEGHLTKLIFKSTELAFIPTKNNIFNFRLHFGTQRIKIEKLKCIFAYFEKVIQIRKYLKNYCKLHRLRQLRSAIYQLLELLQRLLNGISLMRQLGN
jgi:hypothetical protein